MRKIYLFFKFIFYMAVFFAMLGLAGIYGVFWHFSKDLPKIDSLKDYSPPVVSEVFANDGTKIGEFWIERRIVLKPEDIPKLIEQAIIASEDDRFFDHSGIDYLGILRAMIENLKAGGIVQGGSTITQQVVKSLLLTKERTYERKIKEAILAKRIEDKFSKEEILYLYLNQIYLGNRSYGIEVAAQNYFHKSAKELNIAEAAMIAGLAKAPTNFSPISNPERARERQRYVIDRMYDEGMISEAQRSRALATELKLYRAPTDKEWNMRIAPWFVEEVRRMLIKKYGESAIYTQGLQIHTTLDLKAQKAADAAVQRGLTELHKRHGYNGPLRHLTPAEYADLSFATHKQMFLDGFDPDLLQSLDDEEIARQKILPKKDKIYEAIVTGTDANSISIQAGKISGKIVTKDFGWARPRADAAHGYDGVLYIRDPRGRFKEGDVVEVKLVNDTDDARIYPAGPTYFSLEETPKVEAALFSYDPLTGYVKAIVGGRDYTKSEFNRATQAVRQTGSVFKPFVYTAALDKGYKTDTVINDAPISIPDGPGRYWTPQNYGGGYKGPMTFRSALVQSRNVVSVRIILDIGTDYVGGLVRKMGVTTPIATVYAMALGANDMKPMEVAHAFGVFPTGGILPKLIFIKNIGNRFGSVLEENEPAPVKNFAEQRKAGELQRLGTIRYEPKDITQYLRQDLWDEAQEWIKNDKLDLTPYEQILLYGKHIPNGYILNPRTAYTMLGIMQDIVNFGTGVRVKALGRPAAGKTGTTNDLTDCWFVGYVPDLVAGVWTGYDENKFKVGGGETGGKAAAPIFLYYMQDFLAGTPVKQFETPKDLNIPELDSPIEIYPGSRNLDLYEGGSGGGSDFFMDDI